MSAMKGRVVVVTGGSRGIGRAVAERMAEAGAQVVIVSRKAEACEATAADIGHGCAWSAANVGSSHDAERVVGEVIERFGALDVLVNNAATNPYVGPTIAVDLPRWNKTIQVNLTAPLVWSQLAWTCSMRDSEAPSAIVNVSSVGGHWTSVEHGVYDVTKSALMHLTKQLAAELGPRTRVNAVAPGLTRTDFNAAMFAEDGAEECQAALYPLRRLGRGTDIAEAVLFLACDETSGWITGQTITIDGGGQIGHHRTG